MNPPTALPSFTFTRGDGSTYRTSPEDGRPMVVFFGYTHCPDVCPTILADWHAVKRMLGRDGNRVRWVFVSVDPERDTPALADRYAHQFDSTFVGLSGDTATTADIMAAFGASALRDVAAVSAGGYLMSHSSQLFLVDDRGRLVALHAFGTGREELADDLKRLL